MVNRNVFKSPLVFACVILFTGCATSKLGTVSPDVLMQADRDFSSLSQSKGMKTAFLQYMDNNGILLRPDHYPLVGEGARTYLQNQKEGGATLTWEPQAAEVAQSGDLGYTYGLYTVTTKDTTLQGTYVSIWKKQKDGSWKFVLDTGNPGVGKK
jgi:ketosteroid isomerase-like protein